MKKVSVILTTYNGAKMVEKTIHSILEQEGNGTDFLIELLVIDDCSTDDTYTILQQFDCILLKNDQNSGGPNKGRNVGLRAATGDYMCIADQDDTWEKDKVKVLLPYLELAPIVTSGYKVVDTKNNREIDRINTAEREYIQYPPNQTFLKKLTKTQKGQNTYLGSIIYTKELKNILFEEHFGMVDFDWVLRLFHQQASIEVCKTLYIRMLDNMNLSLNDRYRKYDFYYSLMTLEQYQTQYPAEVALSYKKIHGSRARYYYLVGNMKRARFYFWKSNWNLKTLLYYVTSFVGHKWVKKHFNVFG